MVTLQSSTTKEGEVLCRALVIDYLDRVVGQQVGATGKRWVPLVKYQPTYTKQFRISR